MSRPGADDEPTGHSGSSNSGSARSGASPTLDEMLKRAGARGEATRAARAGEMDDLPVLTEMLVVDDAPPPPPPAEHVESRPIQKPAAPTPMEKTYDPHAIEQALYARWERDGCFTAHTGQDEGIDDGSSAPTAADATDAAYAIMLPPPNVTGSLHMGHAFQDTLMDTLVRYHRMRGDKTLWQPGTDHAGIATQMVVERQLEARGTDRHQLGRETFVEAVWDWKAESGGTITTQLRRMGASADWSRERFTLDEGLSEAVREVFVRLYEEGLIYRGKRLVNWDPVLKTAISDLEVVAEEEQGHLWHIRYPLADDPARGLTVATTRPETLLGDVAVAVHPDDERYRDLIGHMLRLPLTDRTIPIIADEYVDPAFGSGCVKITPAHDFNDYDVGSRHGLAPINIMTLDAALNDAVPARFAGLDRFVARKAIVAELEAEGLLEKIDDHRLMVPRGDRSGAVVEPLLTNQWFVRVGPLAEPAIRAVEDGRIRFIPEHRAKTYFEWMHNIQDWCISRQLWWGHQIPAWYAEDGAVFVGRSEAEVRARHHLGDEIRLTRDEDVLDTWFSSALWPFSTLGWPDKTPELDTFYPGNVLVTGHDIIFFWVARMIMMGMKFMGDVPFREVYVHGLVRDAEGNKMSKSKGNVLDPIDLIDGVDLETLVAKRTRGLMRPKDAERIARSTRKQFPDGIPSFGTDALRFTFAALATQGMDVKFDLGRIEGYRNFCNKIWNAARFCLGVTEGQPVAADVGDVATLDLSERWILGRLDQLITDVDGYYRDYRFDLAAQAMHRFVWDDFCDWFVEIAKIRLSDPGVDAPAEARTRRVLLETMARWLAVLHPVMPYITETLWQRVQVALGHLSEEALAGPATPATSLMLSAYPRALGEPSRTSAQVEFAWLQSFVSGVRRIRAERDIDPKKALPVVVTGGNPTEQAWLAAHTDMLLRLARITAISQGGAGLPDGAAALAGDMTLLVPLADMIDPVAEVARLTREIEKLDADQARVTGKLANPSFVERAPAAVVDKERQRLAEIESARSRYAEQLARVEALAASRA